MAKLLLIFLLFVMIQGVMSTTCTYTSYGFRYTAYCAWGCCYSNIYPCCSAPIYTSTVFVAPMVSVSIFVFIVIAATVAVCIRRRRTLTTVRYGPPMTSPTLVTGNTAASEYGGYSNPQYSSPPAYTSEPPKY